jgi:predicted nucleic acid-binding Zn ribbon protein
MATKTKSKSKRPANKTAGKGKFVRTCPHKHCHKKFRTDDPRKRYCSAECGNRHRHNTWFKRAAAALRQLKAKGITVKLPAEKRKAKAKAKPKRARKPARKVARKATRKNKVAKRTTVKARVRVHVKAKPQTAGTVTGVTTESLPT